LFRPSPLIAHHQSYAAAAKSSYQDVTCKIVTSYFTKIVRVKQNFVWSILVGLNLAPRLKVLSGGFESEVQQRYGESVAAATARKLARLIAEVGASFLLAEIRNSRSPA
jgi:hypothetical protein